MTILPAADVGAAWRAALADHEVVPLDAAGCACPSRAVLDATVAHLRREAAVGGYAAEAEAAAPLARARARLGDLVAVAADAVALSANATVAFATLVAAWPLPPSARIAIFGGEYESNRLALRALAARRGYELVPLPADADGRLCLEGLDRCLRDVDLVTFPVVASHRGTVQPAAEAVALAHRAGVPVLLDVAQAAGQVPLTGVGADGYVGTARKWLRGPRGTGWLAAGPAVAPALTPEAPSLAGAGGGVAGLATSESSVAARVGLAVALDELAAAGVDAVTGRVAALGALARARLDGIGGWRVQEPVEEPSGIVTLAHPRQDPVAVAVALLGQGLATTAIPVARAPAALGAPVLRVSLHAYCDADDLGRLEFSLRR
ncbi:MAG TPA: aminotransferase class V-fold PLP-dependent enzyme [Acidimicrobiia bacterium]|nr:aminotransferase class V-fold PLP-dependent enzyme [Acidimicrobiia bacterium]